MMSCFVKRFSVPFLHSGKGLVFWSLLLVSACLGLSGCANLPHQADLPLANDSVSQKSQQLYQEAWQTVMAHYVDPRFNGQDWYRWKDRYTRQIRDKDDARVAIETMLASLNDDYTRFLPPRDMKEQTLNIDAKLYGVGIQIAVRHKKLIVVAPIEETPAARAGIQPNDLIIEINGEPTAGLSVEEAADKIRGRKGTSVRLSVKRADRVFDVNLPRDEIKIRSVFTRALQPAAIGYIRLNSFISETSYAEMRLALEKLKTKRALILDLRGNYGGLLSNAIDIADLFLNEGVIVSMVDRQQRRQTFRATPGVLIDKPLVLLIDGGSASASEILSGALKDHHKATLIGTTTFGKGLVQKINPLQDGSGLNITVAKYYTPNGVDIDHKGITPDITVPYPDPRHMTAKDWTRDVQLEKAIVLLRSR